MLGKLKKYQQTKGASPLLDDPQLNLDIRALGEGKQVEAILDGNDVCTDDIYSSVKKSLIHLQHPPTVSVKEPF